MSYIAVLNLPSTVMLSLAILHHSLPVHPSPMSAFIFSLHPIPSVTRITLEREREMSRSRLRLRWKLMSIHQLAERMICQMSEMSAYSIWRKDDATGTFDVPIADRYYKKRSIFWLGKNDFEYLSSTFRLI
jgi:hypothetical protein